MDQQDLFAALDSPLCPSLAPELYVFHSKMFNVLRDSESDCSTCQKAQQARLLAMIQVEMVDVIRTNPAIEEILPQLILTGKQAANVTL